MKTILTKKTLTLALLFGMLSLGAQSSSAATADEVALSQDWHVALPAELPATDQEMASLDQ